MAWIVGSIVVLGAVAAVLLLQCWQRRALYRRAERTSVQLRELARKNPKLRGIAQQIGEATSSALDHVQAHAPEPACRDVRQLRRSDPDDTAIILLLAKVERRIMTADYVHVRHHLIKVFVHGQKVLRTAGRSPAAISAAAGACEALCQLVRASFDKPEEG